MAALEEISPCVGGGAGMNERKRDVALSMIESAMRKRTLATALWEEAEKDLAKAKSLMEEADELYKKRRKRRTPDRDR